MPSHDDTTDPAGLDARLRAGLRAAVRARDTTARSVLRTTVSAIDNAAAVAPTPAPARADADRIVGGVHGVGRSESTRRELTDDDVRAIVHDEVEQRRAAADLYRTNGREDAADAVDAETEVLRSYLI